MVSAKQGNRRRGNRQGNARRFKAGGGGGGGAINAMNGYNTRAGINAMFSASQIPDNPGYVDFNEPTVPPVQPGPPKTKPKNERYNRRGGNRNRNQSGKGWSGGGRLSGQASALPPLPPSGSRNYRNAAMSRMGGRGPMPLPPIAMRPPIPPPMPPPNAGRFGPRPLVPPPLVGVPMPPPLLPPRGPPMRGAPLPPRPLLPRGGGGPSGAGPMRRNKNIHANRRSGGRGNRRRGQSRSGNKNKKAIAKKTLNEIVNQYPLDKPWVTDEMREEHKKKEEIENKLKGNKDDKLFAEFKVQRDKFVNLYEAARIEYIGKHPEEDVEKIMIESDKAKADNVANNENAKVKANENDNDKNQTENTNDSNNVGGVVNNISNNGNNNLNNKNDDNVPQPPPSSSSSSKADNSNDIEMTATNNNSKKNVVVDDVKQKAVEKPKQQANVVKDTPKAVVNKPRATRARGKNVNK